MKGSRVSVVTFPIGDSGYVALSHLIEIVKQSSSEVRVITGGGGYEQASKMPGIEVRMVESKSSGGFFKRALGYFKTQLSISREVWRLAPQTDTYIFFIGGPDQVLPILTAKLARRKVIISFAGSSVRTYSSMSGPGSRVSAAVLNLFQSITCHLADRLVVYSEKLIADWNLDYWRDKVSIAHEHYLSSNEFTIGKMPSERPLLIGYAGRLSEEKGIINLITAMDILARKRDDLQLWVIGDGLLMNEVANYVRDHELGDRVKLIGSVAHRDLPQYLGHLRLLVIPSYTEGLPNIMIEAMSCGTPVLATTAGSIPDFVVEGETGFLIENNSPSSIVNGIQRAIQSPDLNKIAVRAMEMVREEFTYSNAVKRYSEILSNVPERPTHAQL